MNAALHSRYEQSTVNGKRLDTDTFFTDPQAENRFSGLLARSIRYIEAFRLLDATTWTRFVTQFKCHSDHGDRGWRGEYWGKMMRGAAFTYSYTRNEQLYETLKATVEDMLTTQDTLGRISSYDVQHEFGGWDLWCRKYVLLGMQYFHEICKDPSLETRLADAMKLQVDYLIEKLGSREGQMPITAASHCWRGLNSSSILEPVVRLFNMTGEQKYLDFASYIVGEGGTSICNIFEIAYADKTGPYQYPVVKAYEMMACFEGLLEYYRATGIEKHRETVIRFARRVMNSDITIIGSAGCMHELFDHSVARQTDTAYQGLMQETCVTVTWMKLCWQLLLLTSDPSFADAFEQALYNAYLGSINTEKAVRGDVVKRELPSAEPVALPFDSYSSLRMGTRGRGIGGLKMMPDGHYYGCCACIGAAGTGLIGKTAVLLSRDGVAVNLYIPGAVTTMAPSGQRLTLHTATDYPAEGKVQITLQMERSERFTLKLRIPAWSKKTELTVCGESCPATNGYVDVDRVWHCHDQLLLTLDLRTHVIHAPRNPRDLLMTGRNWALVISTPVIVEESPEARFHIVLQRGPLVLARDARLGEDVDEPVEIACDGDGYVDAVISSAAAFDNQIELSIPQLRGGNFTVVDYASAGKTWGENSKYGCWMPAASSLET